MDTNKLQSIRAALEVTQERMAELLHCALVSYKRYELGTREIPSYIAMSARALVFLQICLTCDKYSIHWIPCQLFFRKFSNF